MKTTRQNRTTLFRTSLLACLAAAILAPCGAAPDEPPSRRITILLERRVATLAKLVAITKNDYKNGLVLFGRVIEASNELLRAELDLAPDRETRLRILRELVDNMKNLEHIAQERMESGQAPETESLHARAARLAAEIQLARESEK